MDWHCVVSPHHPLAQHTGALNDEQLRPYGYNLAEFLSDPKMVQQGYATSEPGYAEAAGSPVDTFVLADYGWNTYASTIETRTDLVETNPDLVQRFIDASTAHRVDPDWVRAFVAAHEDRLSGLSRREALKRL